MAFILKEFKDLTVFQLHAIYKLRSQIFVVEQNCPYQDVDEKDLNAWHYLMVNEEQLVGYCRILPPGASYPEPSIGRVLINPNERGKKYGQLLMKNCLSVTHKLFINQDVVISAQTYLLKFYSELGFNPEGEIYDEDNIPHQKMRLRFSVAFVV
jgi:ElaA protein